GSGRLIRDADYGQPSAPRQGSVKRQCSAKKSHSRGTPPLFGRAIHSAVGCVVTLIQTGSLRCNRMMTRAYSKSKPYGRNNEQIHRSNVRRVVSRQATYLAAAMETGDAADRTHGLRRLGSRQHNLVAASWWRLAPRYFDRLSFRFRPALASSMTSCLD